MFNLSSIYSYNNTQLKETFKIKKLLKKTRFYLKKRKKEKKGRKKSNQLFMFKTVFTKLHFGHKRHMWATAIEI